MLKSARKQEKDPEGRMPLVEHLRELRNRLAKAVLAIVVVTIVAAFFYSRSIIDFLTKPVLDSVGCTNGVRTRRRRRQACADDHRQRSARRRSPSTLKVSLMAGVVARHARSGSTSSGPSSRPGLHKQREEVLATPSSAPASRCSSAGAYLAYMILPISAKVLLELHARAARRTCSRSTTSSTSSPAWCSSSASPSSCRCCWSC